MKDEVIDNSDEENLFELNCDDKTEFHCNLTSEESRTRITRTRSRCIPRELVMDGIDDCDNGIDEKTSLTCNNNTEFHCVKSMRCIHRYRVNDGFPDCHDNEDENVSNFTCSDLSEFSCFYENFRVKA